MLENRGLEIIILAVIVLLLFGAKRLPDTARALGKSLRILKSEVGAMKTDDKPEAQTAQSNQAETVAVPKTIQAAPGESATARPVADAQTHVQG
ncbi:Sec-independent protein translocase subunit TatA [Streptacidiphilus sp. PB12-B1b]|uniref:Sec-independent protein translocase subunit TatA n=1 Tax=Streptacidiphilus sp. PB12-B1b TaxID=2705012 RepID=UPI0015F7F3F7|nr:Sec-independent protein translocase subunit TatA [Streptacidiphilus sp. PB12-B1b]QMU76321.1 Sec-independent protein translocase subunit TatA [Streptacidiphilus sp. PB12-B1b]